MESPMLTVLSLLLATSTLSISAAPRYQAQCGKSQAWQCSKPLHGLTHHCLSLGLKDEMLVKCVENSIPDVLLRSCIGTSVSTAFSSCVVDRLARKLPGVVSDCRADTKYSRKSGTLSQCVLERTKGTIYAQDVFSVCSNPAILMAAYDTGCLGGGAPQPEQEVSACSPCVCQALQLESLVSTCPGQAAGQYRAQDYSYQTYSTPSYPSTDSPIMPSTPSYQRPLPHTYEKPPPPMYEITPPHKYETSTPAYPTVRTTYPTVRTTYHTTTMPTTYPTKPTTYPTTPFPTSTVRTPYPTTTVRTPYPTTTVRTPYPTTVRTTYPWAPFCNTSQDCYLPGMTCEGLEEDCICSGQLCYVWEYQED